MSNRDEGPSPYIRSDSSVGNPLGTPPMGASGDASVTRDVHGVIVSFKAVGGNIVPVPPTPKSKEDENGYLPKKISDDERKILETGSDSLTMTLSLVPNAAGRNMRHFLEGSGKTHELSQDDVEHLRGKRSTDTVSGTDSKDSRADIFVAPFIEMIKDDFKNKNKQAYLVYNKKTSGFWFHAYADLKDGSELFYALGGYSISCGAYLERGVGVITLRYTIYIHDRYNWDKGKATKLPSLTSVGVNSINNFAAAGLAYGSADSGVDMGTIPLNSFSKLQTMKTPDGRPYVSMNSDGSYNVLDEVMGIQQDTHGAKPFSIFGKGREYVITYIEDSGVKQ